MMIKALAAARYFIQIKLLEFTRIRCEIWKEICADYVNLTSFVFGQCHVTISEAITITSANAPATAITDKTLLGACI